MSNEVAPVFALAHFRSSGETLISYLIGMVLALAIGISALLIGLSRDQRSEVPF
jgi:ABC-type nitrate/sulfonate/bicarbonate transport system permease component